MILNVGTDLFLYDIKLTLSNPRVPIWLNIILRFNTKTIYILYCLINN